MKITRISAYQVDLPLRETKYAWSGGKSVEVFDSTVVEVETDAGIGAGQIQFGGTVDGGYSLSVNDGTNGTTSFAGAIGGSTPLASALAISLRC